MINTDGHYEVPGEYPAILINSGKKIEVSSEYLFIDGKEIQLSDITIGKLSKILSLNNVSNFVSTRKILNYPAILINDFNSIDVITIDGRPDVIPLTSVHHKHIGNTIDGNAKYRIISGASEIVNDSIIKKQDGISIIEGSIDSYFLYVSSGKLITPDLRKIDSVIKSILSSPPEIVIC